MQILPGNSDSIWVHLHGCRHVSYSRWDSEELFSNVCTEQTLDLESLSTQYLEDEIQVICVGGILKLVYDDLSFSLDSGHVIDWYTIVSAAREYWSVFDNNSG